MVGSSPQVSECAEASRSVTFATQWQAGLLDKSDVRCVPDAPLNLAWTAARHAGLAIEDDELRLQPPVYRTPAASKVK